MQLEIFLSFALFAWLGLSQVITVVIDPNDSSKCAFMGEGLEGCGTPDDPAYSVAFGPLRNDNDCSPHLGDNNGTVLGICGTHADGSWVGMITRNHGPYGQSDDMKFVGYVDDRSNGSPSLYCELPDYTVGASCTANTATPDPPATSSRPAPSAIVKRRLW